MAIPILNFWQNYFTQPDEGMGSTYERFIVNRLLQKTVKAFSVKSAIEAPSFGFTGTSGINLMQLAADGVDITLCDDNHTRVNLIKTTWQNIGLPLNTQLVDNWDTLPFANNSFDLGFNFSALWFTKNLKSFLNDLTRVSQKVVILCVPNRAGLGYISQMLGGKDELNKYLVEDHIKPTTFVPLMRQLGWNLLEHGLFDCPPWPDIGMPKEKLLSKVGLGFLVKQKVQKPAVPLTILDYYSGKDIDLKQRMLNLARFEDLAPNLFKKIWAHHHWWMFVPGGKIEA